ncbi:MAG: hypothetical protein AAFN40_14555 [Cyanobacteria bacterium J06560_6]
MNSPVQDRLYNLLPALYRLRDHEPAQQEALKALMAIIEQQFLSLEADVDQLYDDAFIETCQDWLVPYIGDLLGVKPLQSSAEAVQTPSIHFTPAYSNRAYVANTFAYRQRKGTLTVLEQLARDITRWPAHAVEYFQRIECTQHSNHIRPYSWRTPNLRDTRTLEQLGTPFETAQHTAEIRHIDNGRGRYNIPHIGIHLWRLQAYPLAKVQARPVADSTQLYWINPLGELNSTDDTNTHQALFNTPLPETGTTTLSTEINVPAPLRRRPLYDEVNELLRDSEYPAQYLGEQPVFEVFVDGEAIAPQNLRICNLSGPPGEPNSSWQPPTESGKVAIDPVLGRLALSTVPTNPESVRVSHAYGFSADIGGGPYSRIGTIESIFQAPDIWTIGVSKTDTAVDGETIEESFSEAIRAWNAYSQSNASADSPGKIGVIVLMENETYHAVDESVDESGTAVIDAPVIEIPANAHLLIVSAKWSRIPHASGGETRGRWVPSQRRAHILDDLVIKGTAPTTVDNPDSKNPGQLSLNGLLIEGKLTVRPGNLNRLRLVHCTLVPYKGGLYSVPTSLSKENNSRLTVEIDHSITGPVYLPQPLSALTIQDSILDAATTGRVWLSPPIALPFAGGEFKVSQPANADEESVKSTIAVGSAATMNDLEQILSEAFQQISGITIQVGQVDEGRVDTRLLFVSSVPVTFQASASDTDTVLALGLLEYPAAIAAPTQNQAAPVTTIERSTIFGSSYVQSFQKGSAVIWTGRAVAQRRQQGCVRFSYLPPQSRTPRQYRCQPTPENEYIKPIFTSRTYGHPAYGQLLSTCPRAIRTGAEDGSEIGAFSLLQQPQREANLRTALREYLRFGLEAGIFYVN